MQFFLTKHAQKVIEEREIPLAWVERTFTEPEWTFADPNDPTIQRFFRRIPEFGERILRVAANMTVAPPRVVSVFFNRGMKGKS